MALRFPGTQLDAIEVFAVSDHGIQLTWRGLDRGALEVRVSGRDGTVQFLGDAEHAGAAEIRGLRGDTHYHLDLLVDRRVVAQLNARTLASRVERGATKVATISDLHLGDTGFGLIRPIREQGESVGYPLRCALAAVREAQAWGAELIVIKGDITSHSLPAEWELFDAVLAATQVPVMAVPGNHDAIGRPESINPVDALLERNLAQAPVAWRDLAHVRVVTVDSTIPGRSRGRLPDCGDQLMEAAATERPVCLFTHHHLEQHNLPSIWPLGVSRAKYQPVLEELLTRNPDVLISTGHSHRNRMHDRFSARISEVSSTKDYPGVWAGYTVSAHGAQQVVRRIAEPSCVEWNDRTHAVVGGIWGRWTPGSLAQRCWWHAWTHTRTNTVSDGTQPISTPTRAPERGFSA